MGNKARLIVFFEDPFWVGICEREGDGLYEVCKITFGAEPEEAEVYDFILQSWHQLSFSPSLKIASTIDKHINPKRRQRLVKKQVLDHGVGTKAHQALKIQYDERKKERQILSRQEREAQKERQFALHQLKRKEKLKGH